MCDMTCYTDKMLGGWLGKNVGGTLGGQYEGHQGQLYLYYYDPVPEESLPNDDFEIQLVWLDMLNKKGIFLTPRDFVYHWRNNTLYYISEYFMGQRNMALGILPPMSGAFNNYWINGMGATIRSEIWAGIAPGMPEIAAAYAYMDASVDHAEEGIYGEMFFAALESAAFVESDPWMLVEIGLSYVPRQCVVRDVVEFVKTQVKKKTPLLTIRHLICAHYSHPCDFTYVPVNIGFILLGLLTGGDYGEAICNVVNCGYDTDCTGAAIGAILGIVLGAESIPNKWLTPVGRAVKVSDNVLGIDYAADFDGVTDQVCLHGRAVLSDPRAVKEHLFAWTGLEFLKNPNGQSISLPPSTRVSLASENGITVDVDYRNHPAIGSGEEKRITLILGNRQDVNRDVVVGIEMPEGWSALPQDESSLQLHLEARSSVELPLLVKTDQDAPINPTNDVRLTLTDGGSTKIRTCFAVVGKSCWWVTKPIRAADKKRIDDLEQAGCIDVVSEDAIRMQLESDALRPLIPPPGYVAFAQTDMYVDRATNIRLIANNTGRISVFLNGEKIIEKLHKSVGILPSWHLQNIPIHILPRDMGFADTTLRAGWNTITVRLEGAEHEQDAAFYLVENVRKVRPLSRFRTTDLRAESLTRGGIAGELWPSASHENE